MFRITKVEVLANKHALEPELGIRVYYTCSDTTKMPLKYFGSLTALFNIQIGILQEFGGNGNKEEHLFAAGTRKNIEYQGMQAFIVPISRIALAKLEEVRLQDKKLDLQLTVNLEATCIESFLSLAKLKGQDMPTTAVVSNSDSLFWLKTYALKEQITISRGDWISDFYSFFQNRKYQVFELPIPNLNRKTGELHERINEAITALEMIEACRNAGDWNRVIRESRPIWELLRHKSEISKLLEEADMDPDAIQSFNALIETLFDFASKFVHKIAHKSTKLMKPNNASKEDAELIYSLSFTLINLIATKLGK